MAKWVVETRSRSKRIFWQASNLQGYKNI